MQKQIILLTVCLGMLLPLSMQASERNTVVFISDLHMNVDVSYAWLKTNAPPLATFINQVNKREDVAELVILGDMLDDWIETVENPPHTFHDILVSSNNAEIVTALQAICRNQYITVTYVVGNHDMLTFESANKTAITNIIPGLNIISDSPGLGAYTKNNVIWAEHGHRYCMFNAPDTWSRTDGHLPLGYFISRIAASKSAREGKLYTTMDALDTYIKAPGSYYTPSAGQENEVFNDQFINALFDMFALIWGGYYPWNTFTMNTTDNFTNNPTVLHIGNVYDGIYSNWPGRMDIVDQYEAVVNEIGHLSSAATLLFEMPERLKAKYPFTPRIVLFGHTHKAALLYHCDALNSIYANTGTWVDNSPRTWVEIERNHAGNKDFYTVSLWFYGESAPRQSATVDTPSLGGASCSVLARDFDGDGLAEPVVVDYSGNWNIWSSSSDYNRAGPYSLASESCIPLAADFDGDAKADPAVVDSSGNWFIWFSRSAYTRAGPYPLIGAGYTPLAADFDGDGLADPAVVDSSGNWFIWFSRSAYTRTGPYPLTVP